MQKEDSASLQDILDLSVNSSLNRFAELELQPHELAISLVDLHDVHNPDWAGYRQDEPIFPASVVKLFYAVAAYHWLEQGIISKTAELSRAMQDMIVDSSNDATSYIVDLLTETTSGPEFADGSTMEQWAYRRNKINDYFQSIGYEQLNLNQKPWGDGPYGRERVFVGSCYENRNKLTTSATARLLIDIVLKRAMSPEHCDELLQYMKRDRKKPSHGDDDQTHGFIGGCLPFEFECWSKAGWTSTVRHDALYLEFDQGRTKLCLVVFTMNHSQQPEILQAVGAEIIANHMKAKSCNLGG